MAEHSDRVRPPSEEERRGDDRGAGPHDRRARDPVVQRRTASPEARAIPTFPTGRSTLSFGAAGASGSRDGLPATLRSGIETLSGIAMDDVRVHRNSPEPARLNAAAFARGRDIHLGPGEERHLPHEAWHVVQQKQGRVGPAAQLKGVALNEDEALEVEADRMGAAAARGAQGPSAPAPARATGGSVIQRKVRACGKWLDLSEPVSAILAQFIKAAERYVLRRDYCDKKLNPEPHLLDYSKKYLLGEAHNASLWSEEIRYWDVDTMNEAVSSIPPIKGDLAGLFKEKPVVTKSPGMAPTRKNQPLESSHARLLGEAIIINDFINDLVSLDTLVDFKGDKLQLMHTRLKQAKDHTWYTMFMINTNYAKFRTQYETTFAKGKKATPSAEMKKIYAFSKRMRDVYNDRFWTLLTLLRGLEAVSKSKEEGAEDTLSTKVPTVAGGLSQLPAARAFLPVLAKDVMALVPVEDDFEADVLKAAMAHPGRTDEAGILAITSLSRERGMIANIKSARAPLLVSLGEYHAERVAKGVGSAAIHVPYEQGVRTLEKFTKQPI